MPLQSDNSFNDDKERREKAQRKYYTALREKMLRKRLGLTRTNQQIRIGGMAVFFTASPVILRERWFISALNGRKYDFVILRYSLRSEDGRTWTALQGQCHDANRGYMLNVTGLYNLKECQNGK